MFVGQFQILSTRKPLNQTDFFFTLHFDFQFDVDVVTVTLTLTITIIIIIIVLLHSHVQDSRFMLISGSGRVLQFDERNSRSAGQFLQIINIKHPFRNVKYQFINDSIPLQ
jgi:hypothetical protein